MKLIRYETFAQILCGNPEARGRRTVTCPVDGAVPLRFVNRSLAPLIRAEKSKVARSR